MQIRLKHTHDYCQDYRRPKCATNRRDKPVTEGKSPAFTAVNVALNVVLLSLSNWAAKSSWSACKTSSVIFGLATMSFGKTPEGSAMAR